MSVETSIASIADLNAAWPTGADAKSSGDDHIRNIKSALKLTFPALAAPVTSTAAELNLLHGKTDVATAADIAAASLAATLPNQTGNAGKFIGTDGTAASWASIDLRGAPTTNKGNSGTTAQVIDYAAGEGQTLTITGACAISTTGWPSNRLAGILLHLVNGGSATLTTSGITWIKSDGSETTTFSASGITLKTSGTDRIVLYSMGTGTVYGKAA